MNKSGDCFEGHYYQGNASGYGVRTRPNGDKYEGEWLHDKKHGHGTYRWANGSSYEGEWLNQTRHGRAITSVIGLSCTWRGAGVRVD